MPNLPKCVRTGCANLVKRRGRQCCSDACAKEVRYNISTTPTSSPTPTAPPTRSLKVTGDAAVLTFKSREFVRNLADLIRVGQIDTEYWEVRDYEQNSWEMGAVINDTVVVTPLYQVKAFLKRRVAYQQAKTEIADLIAFARTNIKHRRTWSRIVPAPTGLMLEINVPDLHIGKLAWAEETGWDNYDSNIAVKEYEAAIEELVQRTKHYTYECILLIVGNDLFHSDNAKGTTTRGTQLDTDTRYHKSFVMGREMMVRVILRLTTLAPVRVVMVPGNHDELTVWHLGDSLSCFFHDNPNVLIDNSPRKRKYVEFGKVMLMFTHGNYGKLADYPSVMTAEEAEMWGRTLFHEAHTGDKHHKRLEEYRGCCVRIVPALCPPDSWHSDNLYVGSHRCAEAYIWSSSEGLLGTANYTVPHTPRS